LEKYLEGCRESLKDGCLHPLPVRERNGSGFGEKNRFKTLIINRLQFWDVTEMAKLSMKCSFLADNLK